MSHSSSITIREQNQDDYKLLRKILKEENISQGDYLVGIFRKNGKRVLFPATF